MTYSEHLLRGGKGLLAWQRLARFRQGSRMIRELNGEKRCEVLVDIGAADGIGMPFLRPLAETVVGVNYYREHTAQFLSAYPDSKCLTADVRNLPMDPESADVVVSFETLHLLPGRVDREKALAEIARILRPGGLFVCSIPVETGYVALEKYLSRRLTRNDLEGMNFSMMFRHLLHPWIDVSRFDRGRQVGFVAERFAESVASVLRLVRQRTVPIRILFPTNLLLAARRRDVER